MNLELLNVYEKIDLFTSWLIFPLIIGIVIEVFGIISVSEMLASKRFKSITLKQFITKGCLPVIVGGLIITASVHLHPVNTVRVFKTTFDNKEVILEATYDPDNRLIEIDYID